MPWYEEYGCKQCIYVSVRSIDNYVCTEPLRGFHVPSDQLVGHACFKFALDPMNDFTYQEEKAMRQTCFNCIFLTNHSDKNRCRHPDTPKFVIPGDASECPVYVKVNKNKTFAVFEEPELEKVASPKKQKKPKIGARKIKYAQSENKDP